MKYCYGQYRLRHYRRTYGPEFSRLLDTAPHGVAPLQLANSLNQFEWVVRHRLFPVDLLERLMPALSSGDARRQTPDASNDNGEPTLDPGAKRRQGESHHHILTSSLHQPMELAFANYALGYVAEEELAAVWQHSETISQAAEIRLTEFLNRYVTYALRTFGVHLDVHGDPKSSDAIRVGRVLAELEGEDGDLLDIGCASVLLAERYEEMRSWVGLDLSLPALAIGRIVHGIAAHSLVCGYSEDLPFADRSFDVVVSSEVLEHTPRPERMVAEIARVLRRGGKAILSVPMHIVNFQNGRQHLIGPTDSTHRFRFHSLEELQELFQRHGFSTQKLQSHPHYMFTLRREGQERSDARGADEVMRCTGDEVSRQDQRQSRLCRSPDHPPCARASLSPSPHQPQLACPDCHGDLLLADDLLHCAACATHFPHRDGVRVLLPRRLRDARLDLVA